MPTAYAQTAGAEEVASGTALELAKLIQLVLTKIPLWIAAFIVILLSFVVAKIARRMVENKLSEKGLEEEHQELQILVGRVTYSGLLTIGITVGLKIAGIDLTTIIAAGAFGIGFALKDLIMNFLAGVMILISRHFTIGDFIKVGSTLGKVVEIQSRTTILQAIDGTKVIVPNADLFKKQVTSLTSNPLRRIEVFVSADYRNDLENVIKVCIHTLKGTKGVLLEPKPAVLVSKFADSGVELKMRAWVNSRGGAIKIKSELARNIKKSFDKHGITIPWPIRTIAYDKDSSIQEIQFEEPKEEEPKPQTQTPAPVAATAPAQPAQNPPATDKPLKPKAEEKNL